MAAMTLVVRVPLVAAGVVTPARLRLVWWLTVVGSPAARSSAAIVELVAEL
jgi:hypothetical protein